MDKRWIQCVQKKVQEVVDRTVRNEGPARRPNRGREGSKMEHRAEMPGPTHGIPIVDALEKNLTKRHADKEQRTRLPRSPRPNACMSNSSEQNNGQWHGRVHIKSTDARQIHHAQGKRFSIGKVHHHSKGSLQMTRVGPSPTASKKHRARPCRFRNLSTEWSPARIVDNAFVRMARGRASVFVLIWTTPSSYPLLWYQHFSLLVDKARLVSSGPILPSNVRSGEYGQARPARASHRKAAFPIGFRMRAPYGRPFQSIATIPIRK